MASDRANDTVGLAGQAASLSSELYTLQEKCKHDTTAGEISTIADELARLSTTLWHLNDAINADPSQYTQAFNEDLREITIELASVFEEISECCTGLQLTDSSASAVSWFFKKGRVARLLKHLEALKGTLVVMRTVLFHGKEYGTHTSDRIAESNPHTMHEDHVILESVLARNRDAILDLHNLTNTISSASSKRALDRTPSKAGDHHRRLSESTGVECPPIPDVLPPSANDRKEEDNANTPPGKIRRTFSKRGVRLGVHMSILDLSAHEAPNNLKKKWIQQAHLRQQLGHSQQGDRRGLTAMPELSRISEVDTAAGSSANLSMDQATQVESAIPKVAVIPESPSTETPTRFPLVPYNTPAGSAMQEMTNSPTAIKGQKDTMQNKLRKAMSRMSISSLKRSDSRSKRSVLSREDSEVSTTTTSTNTTKGKEKADVESAEETMPHKRIAKPHPGKLNLGKLDNKKENQPRGGKKQFLDAIKQKFQPSPLNTPDLERDVEFNYV